MTIRAGTRIELHGTPAFPGFPGVAPEKATIGRWITRVSGPREEFPGGPGWHIVNFDDGGGLIIHESRFRVIDNREGYGP